MRSTARCLAGAVLVAVLLVPAGAGAVLRPPTVLRIDPPQGASSFGKAVAGLGDVNADGTPDVAVGSPSSDHAYTVSGATRAVLASIGDPDGVSGFNFGYSVSGLGDVNGDGRPDLVVGAPADPNIVPIPCIPPPPCDETDPGKGRVFVFSGATGATVRELVPPTQDYLAFGRAVAGAGDLSGDGVADIVAGAPALKQGRGSVFAFSGATGAPLWSTLEPSPQPEPLASFGELLSVSPDVSGDGVPDVLVSAPFSAYGSDLAGRVYLLSGATGAVLRTFVDPAPHQNDAFGGTAIAVGDQDGDGVADHLVGERGANQLRLYSGASGALIRAIDAPADAQGEGFFALARVDDKDGDGKDDVWVGVRAARRAYLMNGAGTVLATAAGPSAQGSFGAVAAPAGDIGGDPGTDVLVGDPTEPGGGGAYLVHTRPNSAPVAHAGDDQTVECTGPGGALVALDGSASSDPDGDPITYAWTEGATLLASTATASVQLGLGAHTLTLTVTDSFGDSGTDTVAVTVGDTVAPTVAVALAPDVLRPPNHKLRDIAATVATSDVCDLAPAVRLVSVTSSEPDNGLGDGDTAGDIQGAVTGTDDRAFQLRSERAGGGGGRVYTATYSATDASGNGTAASATVFVP